MAQTILFVAAEAREFSGLLRRVHSTPLDWNVTFARRAAHEGVVLALVANGPGPRLAAEAVDVALTRLRPDAIVSTGFCGGLAPQLSVGEILVASRVLDVDHSREFPAAPVTPARPFASGPLVSVDRVANTVSDKCSLQRSGALAVEMEAAGVANRASENGIPFFCVRSISDTAAEDLGMDFNACRDREGRFSRTRIVAAAFRRPWTRLPGLLRLDRNSRVAAENLGDFLVDCRF